MTEPGTWLLDLDGVIWRGRCPIVGSAAAVAELRERGERVMFTTNHSACTRQALLERLRQLGIPAGEGDVHSSAAAAALLIEPGETVLVCAAAGVEEAVRDRGGTPILRGPADTVIVGWHADFDLERLTAAVRAVLAGSRLVATNDDPLRPATNGFVPGAGAIVAAVEAATGRAAVRAGKPNEPMACLLRPHLGSHVVVVGDSPRTDGGLARRLGAQFALVLSGLTASPAGLESEPHAVAADLHALVFG